MEKMVLIFEIQKDFAHERLCKFTLKNVQFACGDFTPHSSCQTNQLRNRSLLTSSTVQAHQTPSSASASALKQTGCESAITFLINCAFSLF